MKHMKKYTFTGLFSIGLMLQCLSGFAQGKYQTYKSTVSFYSKAPLEDIEAFNMNSKGIMDFSTKNAFVKVPIKYFDFPSDLMEQHFNENFMESGKYPNATFKGIFEGYCDPTKDGEYPMNAVGELTIHGVTKKRILPCTITVKGGLVHVYSRFYVKVADHKIKIPQLVFNKVAEEIQVTMELFFEKIPAK